MNRKDHGYTLIELLLYTAIVGGLLLAVTAFFLTSTEARVKNQTVSEVDQQGTLAMDYMQQAIRNSTGIVAPLAGVTASALSVSVSDTLLSPNGFGVSGTTLYVQEGLNTPVALTGANVRVTSISFKNLSRALTPGTIEITMTLDRVNPSGRPEFSYAKTFIGSASRRQP